MSEENGNGKGSPGRSVTTPERLTGRKLRVSPAEKWSRAARLKIPGPLRYIFDTEANHKFFSEDFVVKAAHAEELSKRTYKKEDRIEITPEIYEKTHKIIYDDARLSLAIAIMFSLSFVGQTFQETLAMAYAKAVLNKDPGKLIAVHKWAFQFLEHMSHLKGINKAKSPTVPKNPGVVIDGELVDPY